jgi:iron(III) transport system substrate-binding protein
MRLFNSSLSSISSHTQPFSRVGLLTLVLVVLALAAACGGGSGPIDDEFTLTVYSGRSDTLVAPIINDYAEAAGGNVLVKYGGTSELVATLQEEGDKSPADVFFAQDPGGLGAVEEMFAKLPDSILTKVPDWASSPEGKWVGLSGRARVVVYNTETLAEADLPGDIWDFIDPKWKGRIGLPPTNGSFQTMVTGMRAVWGEEKTRQWLEGIQANNPSTYRNNTATVAAVGAGEVEVGFVNHYYLYRFLAEEGESFSARNYHLREGGPGALIMVAGAGVLESSKHKEEAERFIDFMLSSLAQQYFASQTNEYPLIGDIATQPGLLPLDEINQPSISAGDLADLDGTQRLLRETGIIP